MITLTILTVLIMGYTIGLISSARYFYARGKNDATISRRIGGK